MDVPAYHVVLINTSAGKDSLAIIRASVGCP
jgi:hypothetical protein